MLDKAFDKVEKIVDNLISGKISLSDITEKMKISDLTIFDKKFWEELEALKEDVASTDGNTTDQQTGRDEIKNELVATATDNQGTLIANEHYFNAVDLFVSEEFLDTFKSSEFEGVSLTAYEDGTIGGEPNFSIGYGHSGANEGDVITQAEADDLLKEDVLKYSHYISEYVTIPLTQNMYDALFSFCYNAGPGKLKEVATYLNARDVSGAMSYMKSIIYWRPHGGKKEVSNGLVARREKEVALFMQDDDILDTRTMA